MSSSSALRHVVLAALLTVGLGSTSGCFFMAVSNTGATDDELKDYYFTYAGLKPFADRSQGLVLGKVGVGVGEGCTFQVERWDGSDWKKVENTLEFKTSAYRGVIIGRTWTTHKEKTIDVWAGNAPPNRREALGDILAGTSTAGAVLMGNSDQVRNIKALETNLPAGWFLVRLPPGRYRLANLEFYSNKTDWKEGYDTTTVTSNTTNEVKKVGVHFLVAAGVVTYLGEHTGARSDDRKGSNLQRAAQLLEQAVRRLPEAGKPWPIVAFTPAPDPPAAAAPPEPAAPPASQPSVY